MAIHALKSPALKIGMSRIYDDDKRGVYAKINRRLEKKDFKVFAKVAAGTLP